MSRELGNIRLGIPTLAIANMLLLLVATLSLLNVVNYLFGLFKSMS